MDNDGQEGTSKVKTHSNLTSSCDSEKSGSGGAESRSTKRSKGNGSDSKTQEQKEIPKTLQNSQQNVQREAASNTSNHSSLEPEPSDSSPEVSPLQQLPEPTFTRQLEAITGRLDHLMFLQRNALDPSHRNRNGLTPDNSPLRNAGMSLNFLFVF